MSLLKTGDGQARGPDLLSKAGATGARIEGKGILSQLEHGAAAPVAMPAMRWRPGWRHGAAGALCLAVLITAVLAYDTDAPPLPPAPAIAMAVPAIPAPTVPQQAASPPQAATIVNTAGPPLPEVAASSAPRKTPPPARQAAARPQGAKPAAAPGDSDVALLTAMVAHAHRQAGTAVPMRDVVLRKQEEETAELLQRCQQLGLIEGMLCRSRICSGRWDSDPACH
ncbi:MULTISPECIES: hypothetical protein [unclassified Janthinobacterium]|uniref:hypothetical protein n=1 Tax=unclassified Janthinobacterium TaxID=2610881 RepID=UPI001E4E8CCB|nr:MULTISPECIES: hypothetical protein [unclassified Janthinobacterium]MCC7644503.1 hypothetical protein [Janthinobacterium sp. EB271-G4-3-1]MCC7692752.1 hypothetical protein [Janthinobacterium sp. EB271-G4-3-2]